MLAYPNFLSQLAGMRPFGGFQRPIATPMPIAPGGGSQIFRAPGSPMQGPAYPTAAAPAVPAMGTSAIPARAPLAPAMPARAPLALPGQPQVAPVAPQNALRRMVGAY